jgi:hypothetical protein
VGKVVGGGICSGALGLVWRGYSLGEDEVWLDSFVHQRAMSAGFKLTFWLPIRPCTRV